MRKKKDAQADIERRAKAIHDAARRSELKNRVKFPTWAEATETSKRTARFIARRERRREIKAFQLGRMEVLLSDPVQRASRCASRSRP